MPIVAWLLLACAEPARSADPPREVAQFLAHSAKFLKASETHGALPPGALKRALSIIDAVSEHRADESAGARQLQELLDEHCLVIITINPESRVKVARGAAPGILHTSAPTRFLLKVRNEAGVTHELRVAAPQAVKEQPPDGDHWLSATVARSAAWPRELTGASVEYRVLELTARLAGKREATLIFDVGQGTQDIGFRAELPILFNVKAGQTIEPKR
jgi:hypothetical protein